MTTPRLPSSFLLLLLASTPSSSYVTAFSPPTSLLQNEHHYVGITPRKSTLKSTPSRSSSSHLSMSPFEELDDSNMRELLFAPSDTSKAVLVDACAPWCGPCKLIEPYLRDCAEKYSNQLSVIKYNVESGNNSNLQVEMLLQGVRVQGLPTLLLYNNGSPVASHSGAITQNDLEDWLEENLVRMQEEFEQQSISEAVKSKLAEESKDDEEEDGANVGSKRGFVSFASQFDGDDYMLAGI
eukprot:CAMPEP_0183732534 /NCGR_PEP_ID=MMETSP0737-20130205/38658_1 /TAXON_ID=385413 /ORGANISM="Thalassiosira miniscula, Strain CCMP1093" /LENGTH=238 /DNA_ID=CAMNT_0025965563 /DNA_START=121 /DNA_END=837 /DNA_ORIENTATION=-